MESNGLIHKGCGGKQRVVLIKGKGLVVQCEKCHKLLPPEEREYREKEAPNPHRGGLHT